MQAAISRLTQFIQGAGSKDAVTMELAARDFSYSLARIYAGSGKDRNDGFQTRKGPGISPRVSWLHTLRGEEWSFKASLVPAFQMEAAQPDKHC